MCIIAWNWQPQSELPLLLLSNRDEWYARPCAPLHWWGHEQGGVAHGSDAGTILAGRDLQAGGTWLGVSRNGRLAALTNFRQAQPPRGDAASRGELVTAFLDSNLDAPTFLQQLVSRVAAYNPFNLLVFDGTTLLGLESLSARTVALQPGVGGVSNAGFNTPWPKLLRLQNGLRAQLQQHPPGPLLDQPLQHLLHDTTLADDDALPHTGVALELERALSPIFITTPHYGTRACSVVQLHRQRATFAEQTVGVGGLAASQTRSFAWDWAS